MNDIPLRYLVRPISTLTEERLTHPEYIAEKTAGMKHESARYREIVASRLALAALFGGEEQEVDYEADGAPYLRHTAGLATPYISISHTRGYAAVACSAQRVGIDIEQRGTRVGRVVERFLRVEEVTRLRQNLPAAYEAEAGYLLGLHLLWSAKETLYKLFGHSYYDLQHLTTFLHLDFSAHLITMAVAAQPDITLPFLYTDNYVMVYGQRSA